MTHRGGPVDRCTPQRRDGSHATPRITCTAGARRGPQMVSWRRGPRTRDQTDRSWVPTVSEVGGLRYSGDLAAIQQSLARCHDLVARRVAVLAALDAGPGDVVLEVGCGGGTYLREIATTDASSGSWHTPTPGRSSHPCGSPSGSKRSAPDHRSGPSPTASTPSPRRRTASSWLVGNGCLVVGAADLVVAVGSIRRLWCWSGRGCLGLESGRGRWVGIGGDGVR